MHKIITYFKILLYYTIVMPLLFLVLFIGINKSAIAQSEFHPVFDIPVTVDEDRKLAFPWMGGLNNPQFSNVDLNNDGIDDLFVFDRAGQHIFTFLHKGGTDQVDYEFSTAHQQNFPSLSEWALLVDYNCDGIKDIFTYNDDGGSIYKGRYEGDQMAFELIYEKLQFENEEGERQFIFVSNIDIPAMIDVDSDGDMDILTFQQGGGYVEYFKNQAEEEGKTCGEFLFVRDTKCWGEFYEGMPVEFLSVDLETGCDTTLTKLSNEKNNPHAGSSLLAIDLDTDGDKELLLGDLASNNILMVKNNGTADYAFMNEQDTQFPSYDKPISISNFPASFLVDVNNDNLKDLVVSPNRLPGAIIQQNYNCVWYYKNKGTSPDLTFEFQSDVLLIDNMIDVDKAAHPVFFDYDSDGLLDLVVGNYGYWQEEGDVPYLPALALFKNTGTATAPAFKLISRDWANISDQLQVDLPNARPTFGDLDGDGDQDMLLGDEDGFLHFFKNNPGPTGHAEFVLQQERYQGIDIGKASAPQLIDVNRDGLLDLVIGERNGNLNYWENTGTTTAALFTEINGFWGEIDIRITGVPTGYSIPQLIEWADNEYSLVVGSEQGKLFFYENIEVDLNASFAETPDFFSSINTGIRTSPAIADLDNDGKWDIVVGTYRGGLRWYEAAFMTNTQVVASPKPKIICYPNPVHSQLHIELTDGNVLSKDDVQVVLFDIKGQKILEKRFANALTQCIIPIKDVSKGIYLCQITMEKGKQYVQKIVVE